MKIAVHAFDGQAIFLNGSEMRAARDEKDIVPGSRHARAEIAANRARRHNRNPHDASLH
jgi:hypothetical protein